MKTDYVSIYPLYDSYLSHSGIKGMKWGIRRYQNPDGTLTEEGRRRYGYNLDLSNTSKVNIAKIRTGEARRRYEYAKKNDKTNKKNIRNLRNRYSQAKKSEKNVKLVEKGREIYSRGDGIVSNNAKRFLVSGAAIIGSRIFKNAMFNTTKSMYNRGKLDLGKYNTMSLLAALGSTAIGAAGSAYAIKQINNNRALRAYYGAQYSSGYNNKKIGSEEYKDRIGKSQ